MNRPGERLSNRAIRRTCCETDSSMYHADGCQEPARQRNEERLARLMDDAHEDLRRLTESGKRQNAYFDALASVDLPEGLTADELRATARRFAMIAEEVGPRRGLMRFER